VGQPPTSKSVGNDSITRDPSVPAVRAHFSTENKIRSTWKGITLFAWSLALYTGTFMAIILLPEWPLKIIAGLATGFFTAVLFVIAHDACHQALTPRPTLNRILGRIAFLPSLHPCTTWEYSHNGLHHGFTNVKHIDPGYAPFSLKEYDALPAWRRKLERLYRTTFGLALLYLIEIWWRCELFPPRSKRPKQRNLAFQLDRLLVVGFFTAQILLLLFSAKRLGLNPYGMIVVGFAVPFAFWNFVSGFLTFQHHTHPRVPWFSRVSDWSFFQGQVRSVIHVEFPRPVEIILHNIMEHTAHHVDPKIPLYHLRESQDQLESAYSEDIVTVKWTLRGFLKTLATCKLYDYDAHRWLDFGGTPTTDSLLPLRQPNCSLRTGGKA
jgi:acyl-lipid omega-6 desaturase (Delta-12 desaturase)